jgi:hypothetical protein
MSAVINASQHVFAHLTKEESPTRRSGYQTLFHTRDELTADEVREIEDRAQFRTKTGGEKWQFYSLPSQKRVITRYVTVPEPDEFGRTGRYLAHSLVISPGDWIAVDCNPFGLMRATNFCGRIDEALKLGDLKSKSIGTLRVEVSRARMERARSVWNEWPADELWKLARLACHPGNVSGTGQFVAFIGDASQINEALALIFLLSPLPRINCSFDTASAGCNWPREVNFWGRGFAEEREARTPFVVYTAQRRVKLPVVWSPPVTPDEQLLLQRIKSGEPLTDKDQRNAQLLRSALAGDAASRRTASAKVDSAFKDTFAESNSDEIKQAIGSFLPVALPDYVADKVRMYIGQRPRNQLDWLLAGGSERDVAALLFNIFSDWQESPTREILQAVEPLIKIHPGLQVLEALWSNDEKKLQSILSQMMPVEYHEVVGQMSRRSQVAPGRLFSLRHRNRWFTVFNDKLTFNDLCWGIAVTAEYGNYRNLDELADLICRISPRAQHDLLQWLDDQPFRKRVRHLKSELERTLVGSGSPRILRHR